MEATIRVTLMLPTNGRIQYLAPTIASARVCLGHQIDHAVIVVDSNVSPEFRKWVEAETVGLAPVVEVIESAPGFCHAIQAGWHHIATLPTDFVFHLEDDYIFVEPPDLAAMAELLDTHPELCQVSLKRQAWNSDEVAAGGMIEVWPEALFTEVSDGRLIWTQHRVWFTTNPSIYRRSLLDRGWPDGPNCEGLFTVTLWQDGAVHSAIWGAKNDPPRVIHIGQNRTGDGY